MRKDVKSCHRTTERDDTPILALPFLFLALLVEGCGGEPKMSPPPPGDFSVSASPESVSAVVGNTTSDVLISVSPQDAFTGTVSISLQGIPAGVTVTPAASFSLQQGARESVEHPSQLRFGAQKSRGASITHGHNKSLNSAVIAKPNENSESSDRIFSTRCTRLG